GSARPGAAGPRAAGPGAARRGGPAARAPGAVGARGLLLVGVAPHGVRGVAQGRRRGGEGGTQLGGPPAAELVAVRARPARTADRRVEGAPCRLESAGRGREALREPAHLADVGAVEPHGRPSVATVRVTGAYRPEQRRGGKE